MEVCSGGVKSDCAVISLSIYTPAIAVHVAVQ